MKYIYDESGKKIAEYFESSSIEDIQKDYLDKKTFISELDLGERAIVENDQIRAETRLDRVLNNTEELQEGEYIENKEIKYKEKPNNFHFWDSNKKEWVYDQELEKNSLDGEISNLESTLLTKYDELDKAAARKLRTALARKLRTLEKKLNAEIKELTALIEEKYIRMEELEG